MPSCPRCGSGLLPTATICTACCQPINGGCAVPAPAGYAAPPAVVEAAPVATAPPEPVVEAVAEAAQAPVESSRQSAAIGIPNQRGAAFTPMQKSTAPLPPNPYLAAERRQYARLREAVAEGLAESTER